MMNDNTILRIHVPAKLYESVKKQLTLKEAKGDMSGGAYTEVVKEKKPGSTPKATTPKKSNPTTTSTPASETEVEGKEKTPKTFDVKKLKEFKAMLEAMISKMEEGKEGSKEEEYEDGEEEEDATKEASREEENEEE
jgi:hypothetical protein